MSEDKIKKLSTESYKGVRDFYPEEMFVQNYIFSTWKKVAKSFGYEEYSASLLEPSELYRAKTGEEIVNDQTYTFIDRGEREVTLRPEMTPTVARMVATKKRELSFPLRWYSIPNLFRYEQPQRGRLREHWQLNVDLFAINSLNAEVEIISIAHSIMLAFGAKESDFEIKINSRKLMNKFFADLGLNEEQSHKFQKLIDRKKKIDDFDKQAELIIGKKFTAKILPNDEIKDLLKLLREAGIKNATFDETIVRGFDYYTGVVFEVFDTNPLNKRSLFGGGRYDNLLSIFGEENGKNTERDKVPAVGFGMGDVTIKDFLETHHLLPPYRSSTNLSICLMSLHYAKEADNIATILRKNGLNVTVNYSDRKIGDQIKNADKHKIPFILCIGEDEIKNKKYKVKNMETGEEKVLHIEEISHYIESTNH
jgi:histidyl-tRNA synthetase